MSEIRILNFDFGRSSPQSLLRLVFYSRKTAPRQPSPNGLVERSVRIFEDGMKKWAHGRLCVSYLFVRWIAPVTRTHDNSNFKSYYIHIIDKLFPSTSQQMNLAKITRFFTTFLGITTSKKLHITHLLFYQTMRSFAEVITSWNLFAQWTSIWNGWLVTATKLRRVLSNAARCATRLNWARL